MKNLLAGIRRFQTGYFDTHRELFQGLAKGQKPDALFITCSDSRVNPSLITDTRPGEMFEIRNAGNMMPSYEQARTGFSGEAATLQYAIEVLQVQHIIICGHTDCGAVRALMAPPENLQNLDVVKHWIDQAAHLRELIDEKFSHLEPDERHVAAIEQNVLIQLEDMLTFPFIKRRLAAGRLMVHGWVYHIGDGVITAYDPDHDKFAPVHEVYGQGVPVPRATSGDHAPLIQVEALGRAASALQQDAGAAGKPPATSRRQ
jgi:carbonic anhydrase